MEPDELLALEFAATEDARLAALVAQSYDQVAAILAADFVFVHSNVRIDDRASYLELLERRQAIYREVRRTGLRVLRTTSSTGLMLSRLTQVVEYLGDRLVLDCLSLAGFRRESDRWRIVSLQSTVIPEGHIAPPHA